MSKKKTEKPNPLDEENPLDFSAQMGLFPVDIPFGTNIGCGGKAKNKEGQKPKNQQNKS
ncbi:MAG: hypothetical protein HLUCCX10_13135 [Algoriphagus marincola HL-49]|uniref:Uncharacterized protein n=1 Tax=Algoriphagus marincola HL-49 TaxID=1305737 RepID=A0A0P8BU40_9BACT|nr:MAG: hypothetical protein HLUCCX10_13135 [Algoriphagus marincola HL-49]